MDICMVCELMIYVLLPNPYFDLKQKLHACKRYQQYFKRLYPAIIKYELNKNTVQAHNQLVPKT